MKNKKIIISAVLAAVAISVGAFSILASGAGMFDDTNSADNEGAEEVSSAGVLSDEEKSRMIEERKEERRKYGGMTTEERLLAKGEYRALEELKKIEAENSANEEYAEYAARMKAIDDKNESERNTVVFNMLKNAGYYPDGFDEDRFVKDEDYYLDCISDVCKCYSEQKDSLTDYEKEKAEEYIEIAYSHIIDWYPQSDKSTETYELIEETLDMEYVQRIYTEDPLEFYSVKRT